jgi:predicted acyltransferase
MNTNAAAWYDNEVLLKRFPYSTAWSPERPYNAGGYQTLNFIPSLATMIFGLMAGELLRGRLSGNLKALRLLWAGLACLVLGLACDSQMWPFLASDRFVICPIVKRIWTPSWALFSSAWTFWTLAFFYYVMDVCKFRFWAFPLIVVGMNSITMYVMAGLMKGWVSQQIKIHVGSAARHLWDKNLFDDATMSGSLALQASTLFALWLICYLMYRQRLFVRI